MTTKKEDTTAANESDRLAYWARWRADREMNEPAETDKPKPYKVQKFNETGVFFSYENCETRQAAIDRAHVCARQTGFSAYVIAADGSEEFAVDETGTVIELS